MVDAAWGDDMTDIDRQDDSKRHWSIALREKDQHIARLRSELDEARAERDDHEMMRRLNAKAGSEWKARAEAAEASLAEARRVIVRSLTTMERYRKLGLGDDVFFADLVESIEATRTFLSQISTPKNGGGDD